MKLSKDKSELRYNDFLTLRGIPAAAFDYRLGNRSALEWVIDQYRVSTDARSGIVNADYDGIAIFFRSYLYASTIGHRFQRVADQVQENAFDARAFQWKLD